ncbi:MAG TPA: branched-chain amino acid ABC transporter substrate-binding protein, partial [Dehalococcoidia bacterium]|nr:branched-chain amino acid ABC transporter substrate-binding protein [Dehalococcoidia bacterium]
SATILDDGRVLVAGGGSSVALHSSEVYDPFGDVWSRTDNLLGPRRDHTATLLRTGNVVISGGRSGVFASLKRTELYDPAAGSWAVRAPLLEPRWGHLSVPLPDGNALAIGGYGLSG